MQIAWNEIPKTLDNLFYALEPLITGILLTNLLQFCYHKSNSTRSGTHWQKFGPVYLVALANVLSMIMPLAILFIYLGEVGYPHSKIWTGDSWFPNTPHGILFYILKWLGMVLLLVGVFQITEIHTKIAKQWCQIRGNDVRATDNTAC